MSEHRFYLAPEDWPDAPQGEALLEGQARSDRRRQKRTLFRLGVPAALAVLALLFAIMLRTLRAAAASVDLLGRLLAVGVFAALFWQCVINIGMNLQVLPVIGVTLPFFPPAAPAC